MYLILPVALCLIVSCGKKSLPTLKSYEKPPPPSGLKAIHRESQIILIWDYPEDKQSVVKTFQILKSEANDFRRVAIIENDQRLYTDTDFYSGYTYQYKIVAENLKGIISHDSNTVMATPLDTPPPPKRISYRVENNFLVLEWEKTGEGILYNVYKSFEKGNYGLIPVNEKPLDDTTFKDVFTFNKNVYYVIRGARETALRDEGPPSDEVEINPSEFSPSKPGRLQAIVRKDGVYLVWIEPPETWISGYRIYRKTDEAEGYRLIGETAVPAFRDPDKPTTPRDYRVTALGPARESPAAGIESVIFESDNP
ncbi:MAG: fibronectin type III domain-containing protein [Nitrospirota bacterium]